MAKQLLGPFKEILTMEQLPEAGPLADERMHLVRDGGLLIEDDRVLEVLNHQDFVQYQGLAEVKGSPLAHTPIKQSTVLMPGFVDAHTHMCYAGNRMEDYARRLAGESYLQIAERGGGIMSTVRSTRQATEDQLYGSLTMRACEHMFGGVTTCEVKSGYGLDLETEIKMLRAIRRVNGAVGTFPLLVPTCLAAHLRPPEHRTDQQYLEFILRRLLPQVKRDGLADRVDIYVDKGAFTADLAEGFLFQAKEQGFHLVMHADQFTVGGAMVAARVSAMSADHLERSTEREFRWLREKGVVAVALPGSSLGLGEPFAPVRRMLDSGLCVAIASDWNPGSAPHGDLLTLAALLGANQRLTMAETLAGITCRAARALGLEDRGVIRAGAVADLVGFPSERYEEVLYRQGSMRPSFVMRGGRRVVKAPQAMGG
ncbi:MAG: imidazolonepropionase [Methanomassiliicoccales archaeon]|nr:imidazolonepropionase [Methanomassiliicoccales archaeon]